LLSLQDLQLHKEGYPRLLITYKNFSLPIHICCHLVLRSSLRLFTPPVAAWAENLDVIVDL
jgi:hypothetical protein